jgi:hypothetical protein
VADGQGEGIGGVGRLRHLVKVQEPSHHGLHLGFPGGAVAGHRLLHLVRRVLADRYAAPGGSGQSQPAGLAH